MLTSAASRLLRQRLHNQALDTAAWRRPEDIVAALGAVQAQDFAGAKWALGLRGASITDAAVDVAFDAGSLLRTHVLRPTWHFVTPADIRWMVALTAPRVHAFNRSYHKKLEIDAATLRTSGRTIESALADSPNQTRSELAVALRRAGLAFDGMRLAFLMMHAELEGLICSGPRRGRQFTYALLDVRAPQAISLDRETALAELTRRYFASHGPATVRDYAWWSGFSVGEARAGVSMLASTLEPITLDGLTYWFVPDDQPLPRRTRPAHLLPNYDEYLIAHQDRGLTVPRLSPPAPAGTNTGFAHQVIIGGRLAGSWRRLARAGSTDVEIATLRSLTPADRQALSAAARPYSAFLGMPVELVYLR